MMQIQPQYKTGADWEKLAKREALSYEVLELFMPPYIGGGTQYEGCCGWYRMSGRVTSVHGAFIDVNPASGDPSFRSASQRRCRESCAIAVLIGAKNVVFHSSCFPFLRGVYLDHWADVCADFYAGLAEEYQTNIFIENSPDIDPVPIQELMKRISDRRIGVCLDLGHVNYSRNTAAEWFDALGDRIGYLHLSDNNGVYDDHLPIGDGTVDWTAAHELWKTIGKDIPLTLEVGGIDGVERSLEYLRSHQFFGMR